MTTFKITRSDTTVSLEVEGLPLYELTHAEYLDLLKFQRSDDWVKTVSYAVPTGNGFAQSGNHLTVEVRRFWNDQVVGSQVENIHSGAELGELIDGWTDQVASGLRPIADLPVTS